MSSSERQVEFDVLIDNARVLTMADTAAEPGDGYMGITDGKVTALEVGPAPPAVTTRRRINAGGGLVHPGLIDMHAHVAWGLARNWMLLSHSREESFENLQIPLVGALSDEDARLGVICATAEMALSGTTTFADTGSSRSLDVVADAVRAVGIRGMIATFESDLTSLPIRDSREAILRRVEANLKAFPPSADAMVWACVGLLGGNSTSADLLVDAKALATRYEAVLNVHKASGPTEIAEQPGELSLRALDDRGVLNDRTMLVHMNQVTEGEHALLQTADVSIVHCPATAKRYGAGVPSTAGRFPEMVSSGMRISLGTDAVLFANTWSLFDQMRLAGTIHRDQPHRPLLRGFDLVAMATTMAADSIGRPDLGRLSVGASADLVIHRADAPELSLGASDPYEAIAFAGGSNTISHVAVGGRFVVENGALVDDTLELQLRSAFPAASALRKRASIRSSI